MRQRERERESPVIDVRRRRWLMEDEAAILFRKRLDSVRFGLLKSKFSLVVWFSLVCILWFGC